MSLVNICMNLYCIYGGVTAPAPQVLVVVIWSLPVLRTISPHELRKNYKMISIFRGQGTKMICMPVFWHSWYWILAESVCQKQVVPSIKLRNQTGILKVLEKKPPKKCWFCSPSFSLSSFVYLGQMAIWLFWETDSNGT